MAERRRRAVVGNNVNASSIVQHYNEMNEDDNNNNNDGDGNNNNNNYNSYNNYNNNDHDYHHSIREKEKEKEREKEKMKMKEKREYKKDDVYAKAEIHERRDMNRLLRNTNTLYCVGGTVFVAVILLLGVIYILQQKDANGGSRGSGGGNIPIGDTSEGSRKNLENVNDNNALLYTDEEIANLIYVNSARLKKPAKILREYIKDTKHDVHIVVSTGCNEQQNWQSEVLLYSWARIKHPGQITRLVSGCKSLEEKLKAMDTAIISERVHFYFSPDYTPGKSEEEQNSKGGGHPFHYFNKPFGMNQFLKDIDIVESYIVLVDPDMIITQIFDFHINQSLPEPFQLRKGHPISQLYGIGDKWINWGVCKVENCLKVDSNIAWKHYSIGPPYMMHVDDWKLMAPKWVEYSPPALEKDPPPSILAEMYSYSMASAHYDLKHESLRSMVSDPDADRNSEPWENIRWDFLENANEWSTGVHILHYCHGYWLGKDRPSGHFKNAGFNFHKGHVPMDILHNCDIPLLVEVPINKLAFAKDHSSDHRHIWMLYQVINRINSALINYKHAKCKNWKPEFKTVLVQPEHDPMQRMHYFLDNDEVYE